MPPWGAVFWPAVPGAHGRGVSRVRGNDEGGWESQDDSELPAHSERPPLPLAGEGWGEGALLQSLNLCPDLNLRHSSERGNDEVEEWCLISTPLRASPLSLQGEGWGEGCGHQHTSGVELDAVVRKWSSERLGVASKSALSLTLSLKGEGTVGQGRAFWSRPAAPAVSS